MTAELKTAKIADKMHFLGKLSTKKCEEQKYLRL